MTSGLDRSRGVVRSIERTSMRAGDRVVMTISSPAIATSIGMPSRGSRSITPSTRASGALGNGTRPMITISRVSPARARAKTSSDPSIAITPSPTGISSCSSGRPVIGESRIAVGSYRRATRTASAPANAHATGPSPASWASRFVIGPRNSVSVSSLGTQSREPSALTRGRLGCASGDASASGCAWCARSTTTVAIIGPVARSSRPAVRGSTSIRNTS